MAEFINQLAENSQKNKEGNTSGSDRSEREKLLDGLLPNSYERMILKLKLVDNEVQTPGLPRLELAGVVRLPGDRGPVGPTGRIEDLLS